MAIQLGQYELLNIPEIPERLQAIDQEAFLIYGAYKVYTVTVMIGFLSLPAAVATTLFSLSSDLIYLTHGDFDTPLERMAYRTALLGISIFLSASAIAFFGSGGIVTFAAALIPAGVFTVVPVFIASWFQSLFAHKIEYLIGEVLQ